MGIIKRKAEVAVDKLNLYENNAKIHNEAQVEKIAASIQEFGFLNPCLIDSDNNVIAGHGRIAAAKRLGLEKVPCIYIEGLTDEQRKAYILADNKLAELGEWNMDIVAAELSELGAMDFDLDITGFHVDIPDVESEQERLEAEFLEHMENGDKMEEDEDYQEFVQKFEAKKTTDDCYTPENVYNTIRDWVFEEYKIKKAKVIRPFYPGGDYQKELYPKGCVVIDNPPFSILSQILDWYTERGIRFFLFGPALTIFSGNRPVNYVITGSNVTYANGATVRTAFITNMGKAKILVEPELGRRVREADRQNRSEKTKKLPKYEYPASVATAMRLDWLAVHYARLELMPEEVEFIRGLDAQKENGKAAFGGAFLLGREATEKRKQAEAEAEENMKNGVQTDDGEEEFVAVRDWPLSEREQAIVERLGRSAENE